MLFRSTSCSPCNEERTPLISSLCTLLRYDVLLKIGRASCRERVLRLVHKCSRSDVITLMPLFRIPKVPSFGFLQETLMRTCRLLFIWFNCRFLREEEELNVSSTSCSPCNEERTPLISSLTTLLRYAVSFTSQTMPLFIPSSRCNVLSFGKIPAVRLKNISSF